MGLSSLLSAVFVSPSPAETPGERSAARGHCFRSLRLRVLGSIAVADPPLVSSSVLVRPPSRSNPRPILSGPFFFALPVRFFMRHSRILPFPSYCAYKIIQSPFHLGLCRPGVLPPARKRQAVPRRVVNPCRVQFLCNSPGWCVTCRLQFPNAARIPAPPGLLPGASPPPCGT